jgi:hypothetical protein
MAEEIYSAWAESWTTGRKNHRLAIDEKIEFINGDIKSVHKKEYLLVMRMRLFILFSVEIRT